MDKIAGGVDVYDPDAPLIRFAIEGEETIVLSLRESRRLITMALTIPDLTTRIEELESMVPVHHG